MTAIIINFINEKFNFREILGKLRKGDKVECSISVDSILKYRQLPPYFKKGDFIIVKVEILDVFATIEMANADIVKEDAKYKEKLSKPIRDFLAKNKINATETAEGVFVVINNIGDTTNRVDTSKQVLINYKGYTLKGEVFDTNIRPGDSTAKPFPVRIFESRVIEGWHYGLLNFAKGGSGTIYIPSDLAYGPNGSGKKIKPNEPLIFDIEIVDVKKKEPLPQEGASIMDQMNQNIKSTEETKTKSTPKKKK